MELLEKLNWRYATKRMTGATVPEKNRPYFRGYPFVGIVDGASTIYSICY
jgi:hypothetical protein